MICRGNALHLVEHKTNDVGSGMGGGNEVSDSAIERRELSAMAQRHREQMRIRDLTVTEEFGLVDEIAGGNRYVVLPEDMVRKSDNSPKKDEGFARRARVGEDVRVRRESHESALSQGTGRPSRLAISIEPPQGGLVMNMIRPGESNQQVHVQK